MADTNPNPAPGSSPFAPTQQVTTSTTLDGTPAAIEPLYAPGGPDPKGVTPAAGAELEQSAQDSPRTGEGVEGEEVVWEARYSMRNFIGRLAWRGLATVGWIALAIETWANDHGDLTAITVLTGLVLLGFWGALIYRMLQARYGHYYRLTNRRLFVSTGLMRRRRDQMELLRVKDVFTRQKLIERWLSLGTVIVVSHEKDQPVFYLAGVDDPKQVMDLVWHHARAERDNRSTKIDSV